LGGGAWVWIGWATTRIEAAADGSAWTGRANRQVGGVSWGQKAEDPLSASSKSRPPDGARNACSLDPIPAGNKATSSTGHDRCGERSSVGLSGASVAAPSALAAAARRSACAVSINAPSLYTGWAADARSRTGRIMWNLRHIMWGIIAPTPTGAIAQSLGRIVALHGL
jgi:hypothetical protein